jgi:hypothetical protein
MYAIVTVTQLILVVIPAAFIRLATQPGAIFPSSCVIQTEIKKLVSNPIKANQVMARPHHLTVPEIEHLVSSAL